MWTGVAVIITSGGIGLAWNYCRKTDFDDISTLNLYALGIVTHVCMLLWMLTLPRSFAIEVLSRISIPILIFFPLVTVVLGKLIINRFQRAISNTLLKESEERYRTVTNTVNDGIVLQSSSGEILTWNKGAADIFGINDRETIGQTSESRDWPTIQEDGSKYDARNHPSMRTLKTGKPCRNEIMGVYHPSGKLRWISINTNPLFKENQSKPYAVAISFADITKVKESEMALRESEHRYRALFSNMTAGFVLFEVVQDNAGTPVDLIILAANKGFEKTTGLKREEVVGKYLTHVLPGIEKDAGDWIGIYGNVALTGESRHFEQGSELLGYYYSIIAYQTAPNLCAVTFIDITERKKAEQDRERLLMAMEQTKDMVIIADPKGKIQYVNAAFEAVTGYHREDILGHNTGIAQDNSQREFFDQDLWVTVSNGNTWRGRKEKKRKDGSLFTEESTITPVKNSEGQIINFISVNRDITEHLKMHEEKERLEKQLQQAQKLESVGRLAGGIAHDFNNMLSVIIGYSELAMDTQEKTTSLYRDLTEILDAAKRSSEITRQLLAFARQQTASPKILDLNDSIESMLKMLRRLIGEDIDLLWRPEADLWSIKIDPSQIDQILANLCINARDAMTTGGKLTIETANVTFDEEYCNLHAGFIPGRFILLAVSDTGLGIAPEAVDKIFEPFFSTKAPQLGTGLGLSTVYGIVKQNSGFINVYSEPDKGTIFKIYFPQHVGQVVQVHRQMVEEIPLSQGEAILLVEDDPHILRVIENMLKKFGYSVLPANNPMKAIELAKDNLNDINLLLTDVVMPEMNGRELSEQLEKQIPHLKTLFMSGYTANVIAHRGVLEDGVNFIAKPISKKELAIKVRETLDNDLTNH